MIRGPGDASLAAVVVGILALGVGVFVLSLVLTGETAPGGDAPSPSTSPLAIPSALPNEAAPVQVPSEVADAVADPVVGVAELGGRPRGVRGCSQGVEWRGEPEVIDALVTPVGLTLSLAGSGTAESLATPSDGASAAPAELLVTCQAVAQPAEAQGESEWLAWAQFVRRASAPEAPAVAEAEGVACCEPDRPGSAVTTTRVNAPPEAEWALQDRGNHWLAYPVGQDGAVRFVWSFVAAGDEPSAPPVRVAFVAPEGRVVSDAELND
jgi:hypothetical protein